MSHAIDDWMDLVSGDGWRWYVKYLAGNDTLLTRSHQAGPYIPKRIAFDAFPSIYRRDEVNPRAEIPAIIDSHGGESRPSMIWYNNKFQGGTRNECHFTGWGGKASSLLDPENTGALCIFAFFRRQNQDSELCRIWISHDLPEDEAIQDRVGPVEPGAGVGYLPGVHLPTEEQEDAPRETPCSLTWEEIPKEWLYEWPAASELVRLAIERFHATGRDSPDHRLLRRRDCEFELFRSVERIVVLPRIEEGFHSVELFVNFALSVLNRRKARTGSSLELHTRAIFDEEQLLYSHGKQSEQGKRPDFLFPSALHYADATWPTHKLRMLAAKTTCKDRWRQVLDEAKRLPEKHLLTLQQGVSLTQYAQMKTAGIVLVVPKPNQRAFHKDIRPELLSLEQFIASTRTVCF